MPSLTMPDIDFYYLFPIIIGLLLLFAGRKVLWLFVGGVAFMLVMSIAPRFIHHQESMIFYVALGAGLAAAAAGFFLQKIAVRVAGFVAGGYVFFSMMEEFATHSALPSWLPFVVGGVLGAILLSFLVEWALIILSSLTGAFLITESLNLEPNINTALLAVLTLIGIAAQGTMKGSQYKGKP
ncbi:MAG: hypothetical protein KF749_09405 [Bacteroidetes bacterium]|nr:hypothetical protein [Bacteroidota bacterium]MCW5894841.1 hypothetical protein [Bacteroidota bacterium]